MKFKQKYLISTALFFIFINITVFSQDLFIRKVIDGDTIILTNGKRVRLIGVDTPEKHISKKLLKQSQKYNIKISNIQNLGNIASNYVINLLKNTKIEIGYDPINEPTQHLDSYNRTLVYLYFMPKDKKGINKANNNLNSMISSKKVMLNKLLLKKGYAKMFRKYPFKYYNEFKLLEKDSRLLKKGFWNKKFRKYFL